MRHFFFLVMPTAESKGRGGCLDVLVDADCVAEFVMSSTPVDSFFFFDIFGLTDAEIEWLQSGVVTGVRG